MATPISGRAPGFVQAARRCREAGFDGVRLDVKWLLELSVQECHGNGVTLLDHNTTSAFS
ncbi:hypothetical protein [Rhizobium chutanense]|uniref:hypothetical protein n=1 Tax=Rhizobium chutanense TaxID=2035448 RepID=UPI001FDED358|nr:hypothetical protein [Rhizobium chutanense]